jgi:hypothetical protein
VLIAIKVWILKGQLLLRKDGSAFGMETIRKEVYG